MIVCYDELRLQYLTAASQTGGEATLPWPVNAE